MTTIVPGMFIYGCVNLTINKFLYGEKALSAMTLSPLRKNEKVYDAANGFDFIFIA